MTRASLTIQRLVPFAVIAVGAVLFASALQGIMRTDTRLAAAAARTAPERVLVETTSFPCLQRYERGDV